MTKTIFKKRRNRMKQYLEALRDVRKNGVFKKGPQNAGTFAVCGVTMRFNMADGFPMITTRSLKGSLKAAVSELLWILSGSTNAYVLQEDYGVHLWDRWIDPTFELHQKLGFKLPKGELGPVYGHQLRNWGATRLPDGTFLNNGRDQLQAVIEGIIKTPGYRRHVISLYNPADFNSQDGGELVWICTCHGTNIHFLCFEDEAGNKKMDMFHLQRSGDMPIGVPFDIMQYALLFQMVAKVTGYEAREMAYTISDAHIYENQIESVDLLLDREPYPLPSIILPDISDLSVATVSKLRVTDFQLVGYESHPAIKNIPVEV